MRVNISGPCPCSGTHRHSPTHPLIDKCLLWFFECVIRSFSPRFFFRLYREYDFFFFPVPFSLSSKNLDPKMTLKRGHEHLPHRWGARIFQPLSKARCGIGTRLWQRHIFERFFCFISGKALPKKELKIILVKQNNWFIYQTVALMPFLAQCLIQAAPEFQWRDILLFVCGSCSVQLVYCCWHPRTHTSPLPHAHALCQRHILETFAN